MNIYVGNLDYKVKEEDLVSMFEEYGTVDQTIIITDKFSGKSKGFGFVTMENEGEANHAIKELNGSDLKNRNITVNEAKPRKNFDR